MNTKLSQREIGQRIAGLRKRKGWSQEDLAKSIQISRPSLAQIEMGNRGVDIFELQKLSIKMGFSLDDFMSADFPVSSEVEGIRELNSKTSDERFSVPTLQVDKIKNVLLYILERCAGKPNVGETVLYKLLYFADFNYYELYEDHLTGAQYRKLSYGPVPQELDAIMSQMMEQGLIQRIKTEYYHKIQIRFIPLCKADLSKLKASEKDVIDKVIAQMSDWSASSISNYSHNDKPWKATDNSDLIDYELVFYRRPPYSVRVYEEDEQDSI
jgi:transcriptional regulator with XRE-family HTH domain